FFCRSGDHRDLHSFPTRRSSDLKRKFERDFKSLTGFSFRKFSKLKRFEIFFQAIQSNQLTSNLTQSAYEFGYYDQAHLNRDFKEFTGLSPKKFVDCFAE